MRRINLNSGPGCGKSVVASYLFYELKVRGYKVELVQEYIKKWAYQKRSPKSFEQLYIFGHQLHAEDILIHNGVDVIITDSPLIMQCCYAQINNFPCWKELLSICQAYEAQYKSVDIFLERGDLEYKIEGRYESYEEALLRDQQILNFVESYTTIEKFPSKDLNGILNFILSKLEAKYES